MMKLLPPSVLISITLSLLCCISRAQTRQDVATSINAIKKDRSYIYGEATLSSSPEAVSAAREILLLNLKQYVKENPDSLELLPVNLRMLADSSEMIQTTRGTMARAFCFLHKSTFAVYEEPEAEPAPEDTILKKTPADLFEERIRPVADLYVLYQVLDSDEWSSCCRYGKVKADTPTEGLAESYLVIFSTEDYSIKATLTPKSGSVRINLATRTPDSTRHYPGCQALWVKINK